MAMQSLLTIHRRLRIFLVTTCDQNRLENSLGKYGRRKAKWQAGSGCWCRYIIVSATKLEDGAEKAGAHADSEAVCRAINCEHASPLLADGAASGFKRSVD